MVGVEEIVVVGGARSFRPEASACRSAEVMDMYLAGVVPGENVGAIAEKVGDAGWLRFGKVVLGVGVEVVAEIE